MYGWLRPALHVPRVCGFYHMMMNGSCVGRVTPSSNPTTHVPTAGPTLLLTSAPTRVTSQPPTGTPTDDSIAADNADASTSTESGSALPLILIGVLLLFCCCFGWLVHTRRRRADSNKKGRGPAMHNPTYQSVAVAPGVDGLVLPSTPKPAMATSTDTRSSPRPGCTRSPSPCRHPQAS